MLRLCCGFCSSIGIHRNFTTPADFTRGLATGALDVNFIYPVLGNRDTEMLYGHHFIRFIDVSSALFISLRKTQKEIASNLFFACLHFWPLLLVSSLLALIAGFCEWIMVRVVHLFYEQKQPKCIPNNFAKITEENLC